LILEIIMKQAYWIVPNEEEAIPQLLWIHLAEGEMTTIQGPGGVGPKPLVHQSCCLADHVSQVGEFAKPD